MDVAVCSGVFKDLSDFSADAVVRRGRFPEEKNVEVYIGLGSRLHRLLVAKVFSGRPPFYRRWVEIFSVVPSVRIDGMSFVFIDSVYEERLIECFSNFLGPGESMFVEYLYDRATAKALELGIPPHLTRLGYILLQKGFTWFKDWYFPEGFMEGGPKIQAEKPVDDRARARHLKEMCEEATGNYGRIVALSNDSAYSKVMQTVIAVYDKFKRGYCSK